MHMAVFQFNHINELQKNVQYLGQEYKHILMSYKLHSLYIDVCGILQHVRLFFVCFFLLVTGCKSQSVVWECFQH